MNLLQNCKVLALDSGSETNGGTITFSNIDTLGYNEAAVLLLSSTAATNKKPTTLKLSEGDDTTTTKTDIVRFTGGTATSTSVGFVIPVPEGTQSDSTYKPFVYFHLNCRDVKRYLTLTIVPTTTQTYQPVVLLAKGAIAPVGTTEQNARVVVAGP